MQSKDLLFLTSSLFCTCLKIGYFKYMPGTLGSFAGLIIGIVIKNQLSLLLYISLLILIIIAAIFAINIYQSKVGKKDSSEIVIDEIIGQQIPLLLFELTISNIILSFILFRYFDIFKFFPANYIDKHYSNSYGIILDDIIAAMQASFLIYLINFVI